MTAAAFLRGALAALLILPLATSCQAQTPLPPAEPLTHCTVVDGDTLRCAGERVRLLAIDAAELPGHCRTGRDCAPGDPVANTESLRASLGESMTIRRVGRDHYGRTLALVTSGGIDLSCRQLAAHAAIYKPRWDNGGHVMARCPEAAARATFTP